MKTKLSKASNLQKWQVGRGRCANSNTAAVRLSPLVLYARVPGGQFHAQCHWTGPLRQGCTVHFNRAGPTESDSPRYPLVSRPGVGLCICSEILGGGPLKRRFCAFLCHFPGADGVLKLWMQCPSFQASAVSVERMPRLKVRECGVKPIKNEASRSGRGGSQVWDRLSVLISAAWLWASCKLSMDSHGPHAVSFRSAKPFFPRSFFVHKKYFNK